MYDFKTNLTDNRLAEEATHGLDGVIDKTDPTQQTPIWTGGAVEDIDGVALSIIPLT